MGLVTWNPNDKSNYIELNNNNLTVIASGSTYPSVRATESKTQGKWYWELVYEADYNHGMGICSKEWELSTWLGNKDKERVYLGHNGQWWNYGKAITSTRTILKVGDIVGFILDTDNKKIQITINGVMQPDILSFDYSECFPVFGKTTSSEGTVRVTANFGNTPFNIVNSNINLWNKLVTLGYKPYDLENASWNWSINRYLIQDKNNILYSLDNSSTINILDSNLTEDLFKNRGMSDPILIQNKESNQKEIYGVNKGELGTGKVFEFDLNNDMKTIK